MLKALLLTLVASASLGAQAPMRATTSQVDDVRFLYEVSKGNITAAAEQVPESLYGFKPTPDVRSLGELFVHVANVHRAFCAMALSDSGSVADGKWTTKADVVAALKASNEYCDKAYTMSDAEALQPLSEPAQKAYRAFGLGIPRSRILVLNLTAWHDNEHYGNVVTYMRLKGMVPPSSQPRK